MQRVLLFILLALQGNILSGQTRSLDFRYAPASWFTAICFPGDWQKSVATSSGTLGDDFAPGPYARPLSEITFGAKGHTLQPRSVVLEDPHIPIATAELSDETVTIQQLLFAVPPSGSYAPTHTFLGGKIERLGGLTGCSAWASPPDFADPAFRGAAWGVNRPVKYNLRVAAGSRHRVALGLCEPYKTLPRKRLLVLRVEGAGDAVADPVRDGRINVPYVYSFDAHDVDNNGLLTIEAHAAMESPDPNVILNAIWMFPAGFALDSEALIRGRLTDSAEVYWRCGTETDAQPELSREDALLGTFPGDTVTPTLILRTRRPLVFDSTSGTVLTLGRSYIRSFPVANASEQHGDTMTLEFPKGTAAVGVFVTRGAPGPSEEMTAASVPAALDSARSFWRQQSGLPFGRIVLPESDMQALLDASIRNLYAIAETVDGHRQFQPGPSVYRGLWIHDAVWHNSAALMLGDTASARACIEGMLSHQRYDGQVEVMAPYPMNRETPLTLWLMCRYARLTNDRSWLEQHWTAVQRGIRWLWELHRSTLKDPHMTSYGLFPPGFSDGGLAGLETEYGSVYWGLAGLSSTAVAARWLGHDDDAAQWETYFNELLKAFRTASTRDQRTDRFGNTYLPMKVGDTSSTTPPQLANWGILDAQGLGNIFTLGDSLVRGTLRMLRADTQEGLPPNTGWLKDGLWPFFGTLEAIAHLYVQEYDAATDLLYAIANHASPTWTWVEEQLPRELGTRTTGDGSNATASALFIKLIRRMIILERDTTMDLLAGIPAEWYRPGAHMEVKALPTLFGQCSFKLDVARDSSRVTVIVNPLLDGAVHGSVVLSLRQLKQAGFLIRQSKPAPDSLRFSSGKGVRLVLTRPR
jgi:hypothetical protein